MELGEKNNKSEKHSEIVNKILTFLGTRGPTLPIQISSQTGLSTIFTNAFLSELLGKKLVKTSNMRIGSSPLYYLPGQEEQLLNFIENIKGKERDALDLIMKEGIIRDEYLEPAIRVAIRGIKDFANPVQANTAGKTIIFWRFFKIGDLEAKEKIREMLEERIGGEKRAEEKQEKKQEIQETREVEEEREIEVRKETIKKEEGRKGETKPLIIDGERPPFYQDLMGYLKERNIEHLEDMEVTQKEIIAKIKINTVLGEMPFLLVAKNKKTINKEEVSIITQKALYNKMPSLILIRKEITKQINKLKDGNNLIIMGYMK